MTEENLETLKDIKIGCKHCMGEWVNYQKARSLAILWVKRSDDIANDPEAAQDALRDFWMDRLNIKEEDLT